MLSRPEFCTWHKILSWHILACYFQKSVLCLIFCLAYATFIYLRALGQVSCKSCVSCVVLCRDLTIGDQARWILWTGLGNHVKSSPNWPFPCWSFWSFAQRLSTEKLCLHKRLGGTSSLGSMAHGFSGVSGESSNKPPIWGWFIPPIFGDLGMVYYCFTNITDIRKMMTMKHDETVK